MKSSSHNQPLANDTFISIQTESFDLQQQIDCLEQDNVNDGAVVTFVGRVRKLNGGANVQSLTLEHYAGMTEKSLAAIIDQARERWSIGRVHVIHRIGQLFLGEQIVFVGVTSKHRHDAYAANEFIMDYLKIKAPFWKKEQTTSGEHWVKANDADQEKACSWS